MSYDTLCQSVLDRHPPNPWPFLVGILLTGAVLYTLGRIA